MTALTTPDLTPIISSNDHIMSSAASALDSSSVRPAAKMAESEKEFGQPSDALSVSSGGSRALKTSQTVARVLKGEEKEWTAVAEKKGPLHLLDLPVVILKEIVKEVTHTNDLTSLALTHSALHELAIPHIYSRFDIVWPDSQAVSDVRNGVDALTYGLATLVMAQDVFGEASNQQVPRHPYHKCSHCGRLDRCQHSSRAPQTRRRIRRGNHFAQYTRKFSLGNGPADWVQEYLITKEGGKMLGTLVALAIGRMRNLEQFVWDMPTGVLRDVWAALASLGDRDDGQPCQLEKIWVRWHNNSDPEGTPPSANLASMNPTLLSTVSPGGHPQSIFHIPQYPRVEFPTFSNLPSLKSLTVLDIDELSYVEEMSLLLERSRERLRELRIGIAHHSQDRPWVIIPDDKGAINRPNSGHRPGGVLGVLFAKVIETIDFETAPYPGAGISELQPALAQKDPFDSPCPTEKQRPANANKSEQLQAALRLSMAHLPLFSDENAPTNEQGRSGPLEKDIQTIASALSQSTISDAPPSGLFHDESVLHDTATHDDGTSTPVTVEKDAKFVVDGRQHKRRSSIPTECEKRYARDSLKLQLEVLSLERIPLHVPVLSKSIDWTRLTSLTILHCDHHEQLWKALRKKFIPKSSLYGSMSARSSRSSPYSKHYSTSRLSIPMAEYPLRLKRLQTDAVSSHLISFIRDALAPDSLEWLFLQEGRPYRSNVTVESIYKGTIRRHRGSLKKLLIDSEDRDVDGQPVNNHHWRRWILNREVLTFITSGKMPNLRELGMSIEYKDWHLFLRKLPLVPQLRSLYIPYFADHVHGNNLDSQELALQVLDIVSLRPELELCYLGIQTKCFEILEYAGHEKFSTSNSSGGGSSFHGPMSPVGSSMSTESDGGMDDPHHNNNNNIATAANTNNNNNHHHHHHHHHTPYHDDDEDEDGDDDDNGDLASDPAADYSDDDSSDDMDRTSGGGSGGSKKSKHFKLREILFYDDKVSIFKARHGKI